MRVSRVFGRDVYTNEIHLTEIRLKRARERYFLIFLVNFLILREIDFEGDAYDTLCIHLRDTREIYGE